MTEHNPSEGIPESFFEEVGEHLREGGTPMDYYTIYHLNVRTMYWENIIVWNNDKGKLDAEEIVKEKGDEHYQIMSADEFDKKEKANAMVQSYLKFVKEKKPSDLSSQLSLAIHPSEHFTYYFNKEIKGDGLYLLKQIDNDVTSIVFLDPQYRGVLDKMNYGNEGERQKERSKLPQMDDDTIKKFVSETDRVLKPSGHLFLWVDKFHLCEGIDKWIKGTSLSIVDMITWDKMRMGMGYRTRRQCEYLMVLQKEPKRAKDVWINRSIRDIWQEKIIGKKHPHQKPIGLQKTLIEAVSKEGDLVIDPCAGGFSVLDICKQTKRVFLGCDIK